MSANSGKIFCIGLPKTGTTSLHLAVKMLGLRSAHFPHDDCTVTQLRSGDYRLEVMKEYDIVSDIPIPAIFPQLDRAFPGSKFIYTRRDRSSWLRSQEKAGFNHDNPAPGTTREFYRTMLYGVNEYSKERFEWVHGAHHELVERYFADAEPERFLRLDVISGTGWEQLCAFLDLPVPNVPFPHANVMGEDKPPMSRVDVLKSKMADVFNRGTR